MLFRGVLVGTASGKMGAMVASHNKGGQYLRARVVPSGKVASEFQQVVRNALGSLATAWGQLTETQRARWTDYAAAVPGKNALGDNIQLSGENWFIACNTPRLQAGEAIVNDAPTEFNRGTTLIPDLQVTGLGASSGTLSFGGTVTAPATVLMYQGRPYSLGRAKYYGQYRYVGKLDITAGASGTTFTPAFPFSGTTNACELKVVITQDDGRLSSPLTATFRP